MSKERKQEEDTQQTETTATILLKELAGFRIKTSPLFPDVSLTQLLSETIECRMVKKNIRRRLLFLKTPQNSYYLKHSTLIRSKDRLRHLLLPQRRWAEWRNLHRLGNLQIPAAKPVLIGESRERRPGSFFILTEDVGGVSLKCTSPTDARKLGRIVKDLHTRNVYHSDLNPNNILFQPDGNHFFVDAQDIFFPPVLPRRLRIFNLGKLFFHLSFKQDPISWAQEFLNGYNAESENPVSVVQLLKSAHRYQERHFRSRSKRCMKNSTEFRIVRKAGLKGYKRRWFDWGRSELEQALAKGTNVKTGSVIAFGNACIKVNRLRLFHQDRCLASWKMSRALEVRDVLVPQALGYLKAEGKSYFLSEYLAGSLPLNNYLSSVGDEKQKRRDLKKIALWLRKLHNLNIWQRDFKSSNFLCMDDKLYMVDLDSVRIRRLDEQNKITNLAQLNASVSNAVSIKDRLRFYHYYSADRQPTRQQRRVVYRKVWEITKTKNTAIYDLDIEKLHL